MSFIWWHITADGRAEPVEDSRAVCHRIDTDPEGCWYGSIEGCILHGGVQAVAVRRVTEMGYDSKAWLESGSMVPVGMHTVTEITAEPPERSIGEGP